MMGIVYSVLPFGILHFIVISESAEDVFNFQPYPLLGVILLIWSNDTFAYLGGSLFGKHKMIERISPGKTWEGTIFGILVTFVLNFLVGRYLLNGNTLFWTLLGFVVPVLATLGDLVESMIKREANIKDTGAIMPGHGGILDRFDSLIFVTPFVFVIMKLL
jgi:phosphatidate cytidylyltransferase